MHRVSDENRHKRRDTKNMDIDTAKIRFKNYLESSGYAASTIECYSVYLGYFLDYLRKIKVMDLKQVTHETIRTYQLLVADMAIAEETKGMRLRPVKRLFGWLLDTHRLLLDPTEKIRKLRNPSSPAGSRYPLCPEAAWPPTHPDHPNIYPSIPNRPQGNPYPDASTMLIRELIPGYLEELKILNRSPLTIRNIRGALNAMVLFLEHEGITELVQFNRDALHLFQEDLAYRLTAKGKQLSVSTREKYLCSVRGFARYLYATDYLTADLSKTITLPKQPKRLPKVILEHAEITKIMAAPDMRTPAGYRNRIILEILYDTGIRAAEMAAVKTGDLDIVNGYLTIRSGKGAKDRVVPISSRVCGLIKTYLLMVRPAMSRGKETGYLVLNRWGTKMTPTAVWAVVKKAAKEAKIRKNVTTHTFRHTCATHMLKNGAPIRHIQEMLGHASLESTQIYTRVTINDLKEIHARYHPGESV
jgi:integrase/recombinase XerD